jgi:glycosyltransferase involved in cell wall biosynthesis
MLIGIEATRANKLTKTGVEWYAWHVIQELKKLTSGGTANGNSWILYSNKVLTGGLEALPENWYEMRIKWPFPFGWTQFRLSYELSRRKVDVLWMPGSTLPRVFPAQTVVTVHDIGFHRLPKLYKPRQVHIHEHAMKEIAKKAARIITVSEFSGREIAEAYNIDPKKIAITPNGIDHDAYQPIKDFDAIEERLHRYQIPRPFFVAIGRLEAKKNIVTLIKAFTQFKTRRGLGDPYKLVLIGAPGFGVDAIRQAIENSTVKSDIMELGYVPESDIPFILNAADALVHPSWYEGFGIPPVQAMACGCPVLSSNAASMPEVCGDAALFFSPSEPEQLTAALARLVDEPGLKEKLRIAGISRAGRYTWKATAEKTLPVLTRW